MDGPSFDVIIVGAGAAGCVLAGRLSEVHDIRVLLIEAGPDAPAEQEHADIRDPYPVSLGNPRFSWPDLTAEVGVDPGAGKPRASRHFLQGFGVGGGSNIMGMMAVRGLPQDYDDWRRSGAAGWGWDDVLPYFNKLERDLDFSGPLHGDSGPIPIRRIAPQDWAPFSKAFGAALMRRGYPLIADYNADFREGLSPVAMSNLPDQRVSASMAYLTKAVRRRPNLTILSDAFVERLDVSKGRVGGVTVRMAEGRRRFSAHETIVSCGGLHSPALLMRSGIGPAAPLKALGIEVVHDLPGVGRNLQNHATFQVAAHLRRHSMQPRDQRGWGQNCLHYSSGVEGCAEGDMLLVSVNRTSWHPLGRRIGALAAAIHKPFSKGSVELAGADPAAPPRVRFNLLSDPRDFERMVGGLRLIMTLFSDPDVVGARNDVFFPDGKIVARLNRRTPWTWTQAAVIACVLESGWLRRPLLGPAVVDVRSLAQDENALRAYVRMRTGLSHHVCGTCKMGAADDPEAVVDPAGRAHGIDGLRVVDASIFPTIIRANTHIPVLMTAEKIADHIKREGLRTGKTIVAPTLHAAGGIR